MALLAPALQAQTYRVGVGHPAGQGLLDGRLKLAGPIGIEQAQQGGGERTQVLPARSSGHQKLPAVGRRLGQAILTAVRARGAFACDQLRQMGRILDLRPAVVAA